MTNKTQPTAHAEITTPISANLRRIDDAGAQPVEALLFEHKDGRHAVNPDTAGDPDWHRVGPVMVYGHAALQAAPPATEVPEIAANAPDLPPPMGIRNDRDMLNYLMGAFDSEAHYCERCGHGEDTKDMDSASFLREYLAAAPAQAVAVSQESRFDASERMGQEARKALLLAPCKNTPELDAAIAGYLKATAPAQEHATQLTGPVLRHYISHVQCVADLVNNLLLLDQTLPIYGAQYIEHPPGKRRAITVPPIVSRERVKDGRWIGEGDELNAAVIWTRAEQPAAQERKPLTDEQLSTAYLAWQKTDMTSMADFARAIEAAHGIKATP